MAGAPLGGLAVFGLGFYEGWLRSNDPGFAAAYAASHLIPSAVWYRISPETIADAVQLAPTAIRDLKAEVTAETITAAQAARESILIDNVYSLRSTIAGSVVLGYVLSSINAMRNSGERMRARILKGEQPMTPKDASFFYLAGEQSSTMMALASSQDQHPFVPIVEKVEAASGLFGDQSRVIRAEKPTYINIDGGKYEDDGLLNRIKLTEDTFITRADGRRMLVVVGDGTVYEDEFPLRHESKQDLDVKELQTASKTLLNVASKRGIDTSAIDTIRVYIGDVDHRTLTGSQKNSISLREEVQEYGSVEVLIDSRCPLIEKITGWLGDNKGVVFHTKQHEYFATTSELLADYGIKVYDQKDDDIPDGTPVLVYEETSAATVVRAEEIKNTDKYEDVMALTSTVEGHALAVREQIPDICSASVYGDLVLEVVERLKTGDTSQQVQAWLDHRFENGKSAE